MCKNEGPECLQVSKGFLLDLICRHLETELTLHAAQHQQDVERVDVGITAEERHVVGDEQIGTELQVAPDDRFEAGNGLSLTGMVCTMGTSGECRTALRIIQNL